LKEGQQLFASKAVVVVVVMMFPSRYSFEDLERWGGRGGLHRYDRSLPLCICTTIGIHRKRASPTTTDYYYYYYYYYCIYYYYYYCGTPLIPRTGDGLLYSSSSLR